jgi:hypothetical protein
MSDELNPKELAAIHDGRAPLELLELVAERQIAFALGEGAKKYGKKNFRCVGSIKASVYGTAIIHHVMQWLHEGDIDTDSGLHHLAKVGACVHVVLAAIDAGTFEDDRGPQPPTSPRV